MFGYREDITVAPELSDSRSRRGFMCHVRIHKKIKKNMEVAEAEDTVVAAD